MKGTMKVAVMNGIGQMGYTNRDIPQPKDNEVLVKLEYVGICRIRHALLRNRTYR